MTATVKDLAYGIVREFETLNDAFDFALSESCDMVHPDITTTEGSHIGPSAIGAMRKLLQEQRNSVRH